MKNYTNIDIIYAGNTIIAQDPMTNVQKWYKDEHCAYCEPYSEKCMKRSRDKNINNKGVISRCEII